MTATTSKNSRRASSSGRATLAGLAFSALLGAATLGLLPGLAAASQTGDYLGKSEAEITDSLTQQGYEVRKIKREGSTLEVYALRDGERREIYVDPKTGHVVRVKQED